MTYGQSPNTAFNIGQETEYQTIFTVYSSKGQQVMYKPVKKHNRADRQPTQAHAANGQKHFPWDFKQARDGGSVSGD